MDYQQTLDYLYRQLPIFQRVGKAAYKADLNNTIALCKMLGNPENGFRSIHVAGTNGKGSTAHIIASILQEAGFRTGLYTSPHLRDFRERIKINGEIVSKPFIVDFVEEFKAEFEPIEPSFFELTVGMAFRYFEQEKVDIAVIETGLGGRLDSTNVITPEVSIITNISLDHTNLLGNTIEAIATEKAGIIKANVPVVIGTTVPETKQLFTDTAANRGASIHFAEDAPDFPFESDLQGTFQLENLRTAHMAIGLLKDAGWSISSQQIESGASNVIANTNFTGRWQTLSHTPLTITDIGHNEDGMRQVLRQIERTAHDELHFVLGMVNDKDVDTIISLLPQNATYYFCQAKIPRALPATELAASASAAGLSGSVILDVQEAMQKAQRNAAANDLVFVGGSAFVVAEVV
jgi:dihydrofolate synthase/folylpolyglutamate synthase